MAGDTVIVGGKLTRRRRFSPARAVVVFGAIGFDMYLYGHKDDPPSEEAVKASAACAKDLHCYAEANIGTAAAYCKVQIEHWAKYDFQWVNAWTEPMFKSYAWADKYHVRVRYFGDNVKFQNGLGAFLKTRYSCSIDPAFPASTAEAIIVD